MAASTAAIALPAEKPVAGKQVHFPNGVWSALPQVGPNGRVRRGVRAASERACRCAREEQQRGHSGADGIPV
jgi:hypothetical protein